MGGKNHDERNIKILHKIRICAVWIHTGAWGKREKVYPHMHAFMYFLMVNFFFSELDFENINDDFASIKARKEKL